MADIKISDLSAATSVQPTDNFLIARSGANYKVAGSLISSSSNVVSIAQTSHGFAVGDVLRLSGTTYVKAKADSATNAEVVGIVTESIDTNNFRMASGGRITGLSGLTAGLVYYLSDTTAGALTATEPADIGEVSKPLLVADSTTSGFLFNMRGYLISEVGAASNTILRESRSTNTILGAADSGKVIEITAAITQTFTAAATLGNGWWVDIVNDTIDGTTVVTLDPNSTETIDGVATPRMYSGEARRIICDGSNFHSVLLEGGFALFTADGTFYVPAGATDFKIDAWGGGGGGGGGAGRADSSGDRDAGSAGGGGAYAFGNFKQSEVGSIGAAITVDVGAGGGGGAGTNPNGTDGNAGANSTFGSILTAYGGGLGKGGGSTGNRTGGGGGGGGEAGQSGTTNTVGARGGANPTAEVDGYGTSGGGSVDDAAGRFSQFGGGGGGSNSSTSGSGFDGGRSYVGGGGGGGGGGLTGGAPGAQTSGGAGGAVGIYNGISGGGGTAGSGAGTAGGPGSAGTGMFGGAGGGGGASHPTGTGGAGGVGGARGGGGGGGGGGLNTGGAGGDGGRGEVRVWYA